jgi:hypothetical protein
MEISERSSSLVCSELRTDELAWFSAREEDGAETRSGCFRDGEKGECSCFGDELVAEALCRGL